ncbi:MAG: type I glyceraldehyde-3-phosphate dehydrogenase, partial [Clostridia bacterium]|nr:type I glyceraldehyde-3-phosphate dehydrogenase [Clostridia bacterium]
MKVKIGINGFGRIGRLVLRASLERKDLEVVAVNDPFIDAEYASYLFKHDTVHGKVNANVSSEGNYLIINNKKIIFSSEMEPKNIKWKASKVEYVVESSGVFKSIEQCQAHLDAGAKKVVISAPGKDGVPMFIC